MEPLTTLALVAAFLAPVPLTRRPDWASEARAAGERPITESTDTNKIVSATPVITDSILMPNSSPVYLDRRELLAQELRAYEMLQAGWDGEASIKPSAESIAAALTFLERFPGGLPLPSPMMSSVGEAGLYWDMQGGYADISFAADQSFSFFSRTHTGVEVFQDALRTEQLDRDWFFHVLGEMASPQIQAA